MAGVTCRSCGHDNGPGDDSCGYCGSPLPRPKASAARERATSRAPRAEAAAQAPPANATAQASRASDDPFAGRVVATLRLPNGRVITLEPGDRLMVGRGQDSPLADICTDNISREHAFIAVRDDGVYLTDSRSTNGTYLDGSRLEPDREYRLAGSAAVSCGADPALRIDVEVIEP
jgi:pSer/pThr/pTyr-binding forkhead associated (FHA) protein